MYGYDAIFEAYAWWITINIQEFVKYKRQRGML